MPYGWCKNGKFIPALSKRHHEKNSCCDYGGGCLTRSFYYPPEFTGPYNSMRRPYGSGGYAYPYFFGVPPPTRYNYIPVLPPPPPPPTASPY